MKISRKDIDILTNAITNELYDNKKINALVDKECEDMWTKFKKTKEFKELEKVLSNENYYWVSIYPSLVFWFWDNYNTLIRWINWLENTYKNYCRSKVLKKYPTSSDIYIKVQTVLTIKALGWKNIEEIIEAVKDTVKKEFKNL